MRIKLTLLLAIISFSLSAQCDSIFVTGANPAKGLIKVCPCDTCRTYKEDHIGRIYDATLEDSSFVMNTPPEPIEPNECERQRDGLVKRNTKLKLAIEKKDSIELVDKGTYTFQLTIIFNG